MENNKDTATERAEKLKDFDNEYLADELNSRGFDFEDRCEGSHAGCDLWAVNPDEDWSDLQPIHMALKFSNNDEALRLVRELVCEKLGVIL